MNTTISPPARKRTLAVLAAAAFSLAMEIEMEKWP
jgi:hypothetical protein